MTPEQEGIMTEVMDTDMAADYLKIPKNTLYQLTRSRKIPHSKRGKMLFFFREELKQWVASFSVLTEEQAKTGIS